MHEFSEFILKPLSLFKNPDGYSVSNQNHVNNYEVKYKSMASFINLWNLGTMMSIYMLIDLKKIEDYK